MTNVAFASDNAIRIRGARVHNLRNLDVDIPRDAIVVLTGVSGSGKSSLAFDTLFAEGQRRYLESLSTYTRQFLDQLERPDVDLIEGLPPTISIGQRAGSAGPRSTLATTTEIYDYLRLLYARAGQAHCWECGRAVSRQTTRAVVDQILALQERKKVMILAPLVRGRRGMHRAVFEKICQEGFVRARVDGQVVDAADPPQLSRGKLHDIEVVVDRIIIKEGIRSRLTESVTLAMAHGEGTCLVSHFEADVWHDRLFSEKFACPDCGLSFPELEPRSFSFNSPYGACPECDGLGIVTDSRAEDARNKPADTNATVFSRPVCPTCAGARLNPFARAVKLAGTPIHELTALSISNAAAFFARLDVHLKSSEDKTVFSAEGRAAAERTIPDVVTRLKFLQKVGLDYVSLDRPTRTLSGGEFQRARLAACLGSGLTGVCYVLDEPTIGLHPRDTARLIDVLKQLRNQGNSLVVVEHDAEMMRRADYLIDLGPGAGKEGGQIVATGRPQEVAEQSESATARFLRGEAGLPICTQRRPVDRSHMLTIRGAHLHNLKKITVGLPLGIFTCATGVSGSGKSSLLIETVLPALKQALSGDHCVSGPYDRLDGAGEISRVVEIDQRPIGRTGRSNPATYTGIWTEVRKVFAQTREARIRGYTARRFSFNSRDGRCETCHGQGSKRIEMQFMPDMHVACPDCKGDRFNRQTLAIRFAARSVADVLRMRIDEAARFFENFPKLRARLETLCEVGLGYLCLGQSSLTLSGGEAQRVKLAAELSRTGDTRTLFVLDEPTTGLHPHDIAKLVALLGRLVDLGNSVVVIEHQLDVIAAADWVIDLGPEGGADGGTVVAEGTPEDIAKIDGSHTAAALREFFSRRSAATGR